MSALSTPIPSNRRDAARKNAAELLHRMRLAVAILAAAMLIIALAVYGFDYYRLDLDQRVESPLHPQLRPSGTIGLRLGMLAVALFMIIFLYPLRKRWRWLGSVGTTKHWLDFHSVIGITAPVLITFHAAFKFQGLAGWAYWIMLAVAASGFIGRYLYAQIPRSLHAAELSAAELESQNAALAEELAEQKVLAPEQLIPLLKVPTSQDVRQMNLIKVLWSILVLDLRRPILIARLRRRALTRCERWATLGGILGSSHPQLESIVANVRQQARLRAKGAFLERVRQMFHLWHVVHRPFSITFALLIVVHIGVVIMLGYF